MSRDTIFQTASGKTAYHFRHNKGCFSGMTDLTIGQVQSAVKGIDLPTSRQRAEAKRDAVKAAEMAPEFTT